MDIGYIACMRTVVCILMLPFCALAQELTDEALDKIKNTLQQERGIVFIQSLHLTVPQADVFNTIYVDFDKEKRQLDESFIKFFVMYSVNYRTTDHRVINKFISKSDRHQLKELAIRKKYFKKISKAVSLEIASQFYEADAFISTMVRVNNLMSLPFVGTIMLEQEKK